jgi:hypothetical protein
VVGLTKDMDWAFTVKVWTMAVEVGPLIAVIWTYIILSLIKKGWRGRLMLRLADIC